MYQNNDLLKVEVPSRYLGNEINSIHKQWDKNKLHIALVFPDLYEIGVSHFGIQILYSILNNRANTLAERVFTPSDDMERIIRSGEFELHSMESKKKLKHFDIIGFSLLYELNYTNVLNMMSLSEIPFLAKQRKNNYPIIVGGGPCTFNPEPIAEFFDALVIGDGEEVILKMAEIWEVWTNSKIINKRVLLQEWAKIKGVYIPSFFSPSYDNSGVFQKVFPKHNDYRYVEKAILSDLEKYPLPEKPIVPFGKVIHDKFRAELSRGCTQGCRFCQAGMIYRPVRERPPHIIFENIVKSMITTGYEDASLLSLSTGDYSCIIPLIKGLIEYGVDKNLSLSLPSMRAKTLTIEIMNLLKKVRKTGFTIAPEAGSQRLRDIINKNVSEEEIVSTVKNAFSLGWKTIKLYFMVGLPTENHTDLQAIVDLVTKLNLIRRKYNKAGKINVSISTFIPKSHTPFQRLKQISLEDSKIKINWLKEKLNITGVYFKWQDPHVSFVEGIFARGDRNLTKLLITAHEMGCKLDGWSEHFNFSNWEKALEQSLGSKKLQYDFSDFDTSLPWEHIRTGISEKFFLEEYEKSILENKTLDCRHGECHSCGICDFKTVGPVIHSKTDLKGIGVFCKEPIKNKVYKKIMVIFRKTGNAKFFGHLEMIKIFHRGFRRASVPLKYSEGFSPSPKMSFYDALPIGMESITEFMRILVDLDFNVHTLKSKLNKELPRGLRILKCYLLKKKAISFSPNEQTYLIKLKKGRFEQARLDEFLNKKNAILSTINRKKLKVQFDMKLLVKKVEIKNDILLELVITQDGGSILRPSPILNYIFCPTGREIKYERIVKIR